MVDQSKTIRLHSNDNVLVAKTLLQSGFVFQYQYATSAMVPAGHKIATAALTAGQAIIKYNQVIGFATADIKIGDHVHDSCES